MSIFTKTQIDQLLENGKSENQGQDHIPIARLFIKGTGATLLITEIRSENPLMVFGLWYFSNDFCKMSHVNLDSITKMAAELDHEFKFSPQFQGKYPISVYAKAIKRRRMISELASASRD